MRSMLLASVRTISWLAAILIMPVENRHGISPLLPFLSLPRRLPILLFSTIAEDLLKVRFDPGSDQPDGYIAIRRMGNYSTFIPEDGVTYIVGQEAGDGIVVYSGDSTGFTDGNLMPETNYYYTIYSYNGSGGLINYLPIAPLTGNQSTLAAQPNDQPTVLAFSDLAESAFTITFNNAVSNQDGYLVIRRAGTAPTFIPQDGIAYINGETTGDGVVACVGTDNSFSDNGLNTATQYFYQVFSYNGTASTINYLQTAPLQGNRFTLTSSPTGQPTNLMFSDITVSSISVSFSGLNPPPSGYLVLRRAGNWPSEIPADWNCLLTH